uniref:LOW QUALITY PROTEIN: UPF0481 protein At3g47200-like n=1 Tax=Elaeis guineensis var. tenera TaxID=51953 RepID=A0A8N4I6J0_ELAGV|nr:LOW QUALITY PROTEIN: UPF0481 protein At3g47200-like [Elaeis guineensis]
MRQSVFEAREASQDEVVETDQSWVEKVLGGIERSQQRKRPIKPSIFRVPPQLRSSNPDAYEPQLVSIGPYHHGKPSLQAAMKEIKWQILYHLLPEDPKDCIQQYLKMMQKLEVKTRSYYSEVIDMGSYKFAAMVLLDGCFIIQLRIRPDPMAKELSDLLKNSIWLESKLFGDLLLENQFPYFIFNDLLSLLNKPKLRSIAMQRLILENLNKMLPGFFNFSSLMEPKEDFQVAHILHLLHESNAAPPNQELIMQNRVFLYLRSGSPGSPQQLPESPLGVPSVTELVEAEVKIKKTEADNFLNITFDKKKGLLEILAIKVIDSTNLIFQNLIALEQCYIDAPMKITCYSVFMDSIINTERDVALLSQEGIIYRVLGSDKDIALLFNELCKEVVVDISGNYLARLFNEVNAYRNSRWNRWRARLMHDYFSNPWAIISLITAAVLLVLTIVQTLVSTLSHTLQINSSDRTRS